MKKSVSCTIASFVAIVGILLLFGTAPVPAQEIPELSSSDSVSPEEETFTLLACREKSDIQSVLDALKIDYDSAHSLADQLVKAKKCDFAWESGYEQAKNLDLPCIYVSETQCFKIVLGYVNVIDENQNEDKHPAYMLVPPDGQYSEGPESSGPEQLVWPSPISRQ